MDDSSPRSDAPGGVGEVSAAGGWEFPLAKGGPEGEMKRMLSAPRPMVAIDPGFSKSVIVAWVERFGRGELVWPEPPAMEVYFLGRFSPGAFKAREFLVADDLEGAAR